MSDQRGDGTIDQFVKEGWRAIGLSQTDVAEALGFDGSANRGKGSDRAGRLSLVAEALNVPVGASRRNGATTLQPLPEAVDSLQSLLALRLLRAFHELTDQRTKEVLVQLSERIARRQSGRSGDTG